MSKSKERITAFLNEAMERDERVTWGHKDPGGCFAQDSLTLGPDGLPPATSRNEILSAKPDRGEFER